MSCYFRHMKDIFEETGVEATPDNKKDLDRAIHEILGVEYKNCSDTWKRVKEQIKGDDAARDNFIESLRNKLKKG